MIALRSGDWLETVLRNSIDRSHVFFVPSQGMVTGLQEIDKLKNQVKDVHVPFEVFDYIDQGKNPQLYTKDCIDKALMKNEEVKGKIDAYRKFKTNMLVELQKTFPTELNMYRALRNDEWGVLDCDLNTLRFRWRVFGFCMNSMKHIYMYRW